MPFPEPPESGETDTVRTVTLTDKDARDAARLFRLLADETSVPGLIPAGPDHSLQHLAAAPSEQGKLERARFLLLMRRLRARYFSRAIFGEPAWEVLLLLYITHASEGRQSIGRVAEWIETPLTTVLRWVAYLEKERLVERASHPTDRRVSFISLTDKGRHALEAFLDELPA
jgi:DNA-binding MarR family transcriptional regulator